MDSERIRMLEAQNEELRRLVSLSNQRTEAMEVELDSCRHYMEAELSRTRDDLDKMRDKFRRLQNSYTASQRANQDLEEKLHALLRKVEGDKKTMDQELVELTNKLLDAKTTIDRLEELNERYRQDCNLAVQLLKCNKSHFRNHKFSDLPAELQDMLNKHMNSLPQPSTPEKDPDSISLGPADLVPSSVIARVLEKPEPLLLNSTHSRSSRPIAEDVFVHVDMTSSDRQPDGANHTAASSPCSSRENGSCPAPDDVCVSKLNPYPAPHAHYHPHPGPPHPLYPGRKVIEFSSDDKVKIPKNSPLPNCTYATRQAISLSLVDRSVNQTDPCDMTANQSEPLSSQSSPFSSPPQALSVGPSSSEEDLLHSWQRLFVDKTASSDPLRRTAFGSQSAHELHGRGGAYSDGEEASSNRSWTPSRGSSLDTDPETESRTRTETHNLIQLDQDPDQDQTGSRVGLRLDPERSLTSDEPHAVVRKCLRDDEEMSDVLPVELPIVSPRPAPDSAPPRPPKSPKRMGVHHLHRKDSLSRALEQGTLLE